MHNLVMFAIFIAVIFAVKMQAATHEFAYNEGKGKFKNANNGVVYSAYSGYKEYANLPQYQNLRDKGSIPMGTWTIDKVGARKGPLTFELTPTADVANPNGRDNFLIHGDNGAGDRSASMGCIIVERGCREKISIGDKVIVKKLQRNGEL